MNCPNCGALNHKKDSICRKCNLPLSNAEFAPVPAKPKKKRNFILRFLFFLIILCGIGGIGCYSYLNIIEKKCRENVEKAMSCAKKMDFSEFDKEILPEPLASQPNVRTLISDTIDQMIEDNHLSGIFSSLDIQVDYDGIFDQILKNADYNIDNITTTYNSCTITMTTSNINYPAIASDLEGDLSDLIHQYTLSSGWWSGIKNWFSSLISPEDDNSQEDVDSGDSSTEESGTLSQWIVRTIDGKDPNKVTGKIVFGIKNGHWTLISWDENLIYNFYGFPKE